MFRHNFNSSLIKFCTALWIFKASCLLPITPDMMFSTYQRYLSLSNPLGSSLLVRFICFNLPTMYEGKTGLGFWGFHCKIISF
jgi:hypothetical protein